MGLAEGSAELIPRDRFTPASNGRDDSACIYQRRDAVPGCQLRQRIRPDDPVQLGLGAKELTEVSYRINRIAQALPYQIKVAELKHGMIGDGQLNHLSAVCRIEQALVSFVGRAGRRKKDDALQVELLGDGTGRDQVPAMDGVEAATI